MTVPNWWEALLLAAAAYRVWRLLAFDTVLDGLRHRLFPLGTENARFLPFLQCPWCAGFWISCAWWAAYQLESHYTVFVAVPWAISLAVGLTARNLDP